MLGTSPSIDGGKVCELYHPLMHKDSGWLNAHSKPE